MSDNESISTEDMNALLETTNDFVEEEPEKKPNLRAFILGSIRRFKECQL